MAIVIQSNVDASKAARRLSTSTSDLGAVFERLSTGQRINRASDDAAGLAVSTSLNYDSRVYAQGIRNFNDGVGYLAVGDGALSELTSIAIRIKEIAEQSANGVYSNGQRAPLDQEVAALAAEYNRIIDTTSFNGAGIFSASSSTLTLQGGYGAGGGITVSLDAVSNVNFAYGTAQSISNLSYLGAQSTFNTQAQSGRDMSQDGRFVLFNTFSPSMVAGDVNGADDVFMRDRLTGTTTLVSVATGGTQGNGASSFGSISDDGNVVVFASSATNLTAGDSNGLFDVFARDLTTGVTTRVNVDSSGVQANGVTTSSMVSGNGRYVTFNSNATNLVAGDSNGASDVFVHDRNTGVTTRDSLTDGDAQSVGGSSVGGISDDGRYVVFTSSASDLVAGDTNGQQDIFVRDRLLQTTRRVSVSSAGVEANGINLASARISGNGRYVAWNSQATNLVAGDTNGLEDVFRHDLLTGTTIRISVDSAGNESSGGLSRTGTLSDDGRYVSFTSFATNLVAGDTNGIQDGFVRDTVTGLTIRASVSDAGAESNGATGVISVSPDGKYVLLNSSGSNIVAGDANGQQDIFLSGNSLAAGLGVTPLTRLDGLSVATQGAALSTLDLIDDNQAEVATLRATIGSALSRIGTATSNLGTTVDNYREAESRITDADVATEAASMLRLQILQRSGAAILAQTSQQPSLVLQLLDLNPRG